MEKFRNIAETGGNVLGLAPNLLASAKISEIFGGLAANLISMALPRLAEGEGPRLLADLLRLLAADLLLRLGSLLRTLIMVIWAIMQIMVRRRRKRKRMERCDLPLLDFLRHGRTI